MNMNSLNNSLRKTPEFMSNVEKLAKLQVTKPSMENTRIVKKMNDMYNNEIEEQKKKIIMKAIPESIKNNVKSIANNNWFDVERAVIDDINTQLLLAECKQQTNDYNKFGNIFAKVANSNQDALMAQLDELTRQQETKEATKEALVRKQSALNRLFNPQTFEKILTLPEVKAEYDECLKFLPKKTHDNFYKMMLKKCCKGDITKDTVLAAIQDTKEKINKQQPKALPVSNKQNLSSSLLDGKDNPEDFDELKTDINLYTSKNLQFGASHDLAAKVSNANPRSMSQKQQSNQRGGR